MSFKLYGILATTFLMLVAPDFGQPKTSGKKAKPAKPAVYTQEIAQAVAKDLSQLIDIFKDFHANPELGFMEVRTAGIVVKELKSLGYEEKESIGKTGVLGI